MSKVVIEDTTLKNIADAVREKTNTTDKMLPSAMPDLIKSITGGGTDLPENMHIGTFTLANDTSEDIVIEHGLSGTPKAFYCLIDELGDIYIPYSICGAVYDTFSAGIYRSNYKGGSGGMYVNVAPTLGETTVIIPVISSSYAFRSGYTYRWIAWL